MPEAAIKPFSAACVAPAVPCSPIAGRARVYACCIEPTLYVFASFYVFASLIAGAIKDAKIIPAKTPANPHVKPLDAKKSP
jgi:hypothetical protein